MEISLENHSNPEHFFTWAPDGDQRQVAIQPLHSSGFENWRARECIKILGLDREELRRLRWITFEPVAHLCRLYTSGQLNGQLRADTEQILRNATKEDRPFAGMCRWTIREKFGLPF